jgi:hypothetical protein
MILQGHISSAIASERAFHSRERALREGLEIDRVVFDALVALRAR